MSQKLVLDEGRGEPQSGIQSLLERVVLTAIGIIEVGKLASFDKVDVRLATNRLPSLYIDVLAVETGAQGILFDLRLHEVLRTVRRIVRPTPALVNWPVFTGVRA